MDGRPENIGENVRIALQVTRSDGSADRLTDRLPSMSLIWARFPVCGWSRAKKHHEGIRFVMGKIEVGATNGAQNGTLCVTGTLAKGPHEKAVGIVANGPQQRFPIGVVAVDPCMAAAETARERSEGKAVDTPFGDQFDSFPADQRLERPDCCFAVGGPSAHRFRNFYNVNFVRLTLLIFLSRDLARCGQAPSQVARGEQYLADRRVGHRECASVEPPLRSDERSCAGVISAADS